MSVHRRIQISLKNSLSQKLTGSHSKITHVNYYHLIWFVNQNTEILTNAITEAAEHSIPQGGNNKRKRLKPLPYWNQNCKIAVQDRNKARYATNKNKTLDNCLKYRKLKGKAQYVIKSTACEYSQEYCSTLHCVSKKVPTFKLSVTLSNLNRFLKSLHCWKVWSKEHLPTLSRTSLYICSTQNSWEFSTPSLEWLQTAVRIRWKCFGFPVVWKVYSSVR